MAEQRDDVAELARVLARPGKPIVSARWRDWYARARPPMPGPGGGEGAFLELLAIGTRVHRFAARAALLGLPTRWFPTNARVGGQFRRRRRQRRSATSPQASRRAHQRAPGR